MLFNWHYFAYYYPASSNAKDQHELKTRGSTSTTASYGFINITKNSMLKIQYVFLPPRGLIFSDSFHMASSPMQSSKFWKNWIIFSFFLKVYVLKITPQLYYRLFLIEILKKNNYFKKYLLIFELLHVFHDVELLPSFREVNHPVG